MDGYGSAACNNSIGRSLCISQPPTTAPDITSITQPDNGSLIQTRRIKVSWDFPNGTGCGNPWGFAETSNFNQTGVCNNANQQNEFRLRVLDGVGQVGPTMKVSSKTGPGLQSYTYPGVGDPSFPGSPLMANKQYTLEICAHNGYDQLCATQPFTKTSFAQATAQGSLYEFETNTRACLKNFALDTAGSLSLLASPSLPSGGSLACTARNTDANPNYDSYTCNVSLDNVNHDIDTTRLSTTGYNFLLQIPPKVTYANYYCTQSSLGGSCNLNNLNGQKLCTDPTNPLVASFQFDKNQGGVNTTVNKDIIGEVDDNAKYSYYKLKHASYADFTGLQSLFPANPQVFDQDDDGSNYLIIGQSLSDVSSVGSVISGGAGVYDLGNPVTAISVKQWQHFNYRRTSLNITPATFLDYVRSRKDYVSVTGNSLPNNIDTNKIYVQVGNLTLKQNDIAPISNKNIILLVQGDLTFTSNANKINPGNGSSTIMFIATGTLTFDGNTKEARGLFIGNNVDLGTSNDELKVIGNLVSATSLPTSPLTRTRTDNNLKPSLFVVFDAAPYLKLLPLLSTSAYQWSELVL